MIIVLIDGFVLLMNTLYGECVNVVPHSYRSLGVFPVNGLQSGICVSPFYINIGIYLL